MTIERAVFRLGGCVVLLGSALTYWVHPLWVLLPAFVGLNMVQMTFTGFCLPAIVMKKLGMKSGPVFK